MVACPACGAEAPDGATECSGCHLSVGLFSAVREAAGPAGRDDPVFLRTIGELIQSIDLSTPAPEPPPTGVVLDRTGRFPGLRSGEPLRERPTREPAPLRPLEGLPALPAASAGSELRRRAEEYLLAGRRLNLDLTGLAERVRAAELASDETSLDATVREIFVHLTSVLAEQYEVELARRNELSQFAPTPSADVELDALRHAMTVGDVSGALRRLLHVRDELGRLEAQWATGRVLLAECDLMVETIRDLGGDPAPALGPLAEGRKSLGTAHREAAERMLARSAFALWAVLEPRFLEELRRLRDRLVEMRGAGGEIRPALADLRTIAEELRRRNFVGMIDAYRRLRQFTERNEPASVGAVPADVPVGPEHPAPSA
jgi:hypothetical protein